MMIFKFDADKKDNTGAETTVTPEDVDLSLTMSAGDTLIEDIICNSNFMLDTMPTIGKVKHPAFQGHASRHTSREGSGRVANFL